MQASTISPHLAELEQFNTVNVPESSANINIPSQNSHHQQQQQQQHHNHHQQNSLHPQHTHNGALGYSSLPSEGPKPSFNYDLEIFNLCKQYLNNKNHHGLALIARQKGIPPFLRFKAWPVLLKYHPFVLDPFIQPDNEVINEGNELDSSSSTSSSSSSSSYSSFSKDSGSRNGSSSGTQRLHEQASYNARSDTENRIKKDISRYVQRIFGSLSTELPSLDREILDVIENAVKKFTLKWGKIIKYDLSLLWMALNLAEWIPPLPKTPWVLVGRDQNSHPKLTHNVLDDYTHYIDNIPGLGNYLEELIYNDEHISSLAFHEVYERLVLVLLHCPEPDSRKQTSQNGSTGGKGDVASNDHHNHHNHHHYHHQQDQLNKTRLPVTGGTIEERVSFFIFCLRKLLPELSQYFHEEQILSKFGCLDDEWLIWWLKFCGTKAWSKFDRGRIWDFMLGWRLKNPKKNFNYYYEKLNYVNRDTLEKLGPDIFWTLNSEKTERPKMNPRNNSFRDLVHELNCNFHISRADFNQQLQSDGSKSKIVSPASDAPALTIPFSTIDPHVALIFISISLLKSKENTLVELDQHEIRQFLSRLPSKSYEYNHKQRKRLNNNGNDPSSVRSSKPSLPSEEKTLNTIIISNDAQDNKHKINFIDSIINEAGEEWRKWLWTEFVDDG